jgi:CRP-like cAMP-binding protein/SAM-dependent methyltransferase
MKPEQLALLTDGDWQLMTERATLRPLEKDAVALAEGAQSRNLYFVQAGYMRVVRAFHGIPLTVTRLGPGEVFGEMSFLERVPAAASIVADSAAEILVLPEAEVESLLNSVPGLAQRLYQSLAVTLSRRLRRSSGAGAGTIGSTRMARTGFATEKQLPASLVQAVDGIKQRLHQLERQLRERSLSQPQAVSGVAAACEDICTTLERFTRDDVVVDAGMADLLAFRDSEAIRAGIGAYVFRETFSVLMSSALVSSAFAMPRGFPDDWETMSMIHRNEPSGDGQLGPLVDLWFLQRPLCSARRSSAAAVTALLAPIAASGAAAITCLAAGSCQEVLDLLSAPSAGAATAICIDADEKALLAAAERAAELDLSERITFQLGNAVPAENGEQLRLPQQQAIFAVGLFEYLGDEAILRVLDWSWRHLEPGGKAVFTNLAEGNPDALFMEYLLERKVRYRSAEALAELFRRSAFQRAEVGAQAGGTDLLAVAIKA